MKKSDFGIIGLAVMGQNLARNVASRGYTVSVYNRTTEKMHAFIDEHGGDGLRGQEALADFVASIQAPRKIMVMVKAGVAVDKVVATLLPHLAEGDTIIDGGNSLYTDTIRREADLAAKGLHFFGCGVSGGEEGALNGPSLMPGGSREVWDDLRPILEAIAAKDFKGGPCVTYIGANGAGHFVKMVHNGIEYAVMQMMAEAYGMLANIYQLDPPEIGDVFERYNAGKLQSYLFEIAVPIFRQVDNMHGPTGGGKTYIIDMILDKAGQKGTGRWTAIEGLQRGVELSTITEAVYARTVSSYKQNRTVLSQHYTKPRLKVDVEREVFIEHLEHALYAGMLMSYAQGFRLLKVAAQEQEWDLNFSEIARIWEGGCIIRAQILNTLHAAFAGSKQTDLLAIPEIAQDLQGVLPSFRSVVSFGFRHGAPLFCLGSALASFEAMTSERVSANLIQGLRDFFGSHTYQRIDREGTFHTEWGA